MDSYIHAYTASTSKKWKDLLPICEYAYNNAKHMAIGQSPFHCNYIFYLRSDWLIDAEIERLDASRNNYLDKIIILQKLEWDTLQETFDRMASRLGLAVQSFTIGQKFLLDTHNRRQYH